MMKCLTRNTRGFTLVEILVVLAVFGIIMGAVYSLYITNQRAAYTSDETVEVQQNLRIAMDTITKDLRMAGMLVDPVAAPPIIVNLGDIDTGPKDLGQTLGQNPQPLGSDAVTINMASASGVYAKITADMPGGSSSFSIANMSNVANVSNAQLYQASDIASFAAGDVVRIIKPFDNAPVDAGATFNVQAADPNTNTITLATSVVEDVRAGYVVARVGLTPNPNTVRYAVVSNGATATATADPNCPVNQMCLTRLVNGGPLANRQIVAQNIADFQLRYVLDDESIVDRPTDGTQVKSVIVTIWGETQTTRLLSGNVPKIRQLSSVVKLRNRR